jgi:hypothetical protein
MTQMRPDKPIAKYRPRNPFKGAAPPPLPMAYFMPIPPEELTGDEQEGECYLVLQGHWLTAAGFDENTPIEVTATENGFILKAL